MAVVDDRLMRDVRADVGRRWLDATAPHRHVDWTLLVLAALLTAAGMVFIYSATHHRLPPDQSMVLVQRQVLSAGIGLVVMVAAMAVDYRRLRPWTLPAYLGSLLLLGVVLTQPAINGTRAWITVGGFQFQPSEPAKLALIVLLAALFHEWYEHARDVRTLGVALAVAGVPMALILAQPDFGTFMVFVAILAAMLLLARVRIRYLLLLVALGVAAVVGAWQLELVKSYQVQRLTSFLDPGSADVQGGYWNVAQAQIAVGAGRLTGRGLFSGTQAGLGYVPENHTDFIFTVIAEETGFLGSALLLTGFVLVVWRGLRIAALSRDTFGTLVAGGIVAALLFHVVINVGMSVGVMPVTGLPLPFVSYGGTSLIVTLAMVGVLESIHMRRFSRLRG